MTNETGTAEMVWDCYDKTDASQTQEFPFASVEGPTVTIDDPELVAGFRALISELPVQSHEWRFDGPWYGVAKPTTPTPETPIVALELRNNKDWAEEKTLADFRRVFADERKWKALGFGRTEG